MSRYLLFLSLFISPYIVCGSDPFTELDTEMDRFEYERADSPQMLNEFELYLRSELSDYQVWQVQYLKEFDQFQQAVVEKWGRVDPIQAEYDVEFSENKSVKSVIDYQHQQVKVALLVDKNLSQAAAEKALKKQIKALLLNKESNIAQLFNNEKLESKGAFTLSNIEFSEKNKQQSKDNIIRQTQALAQETDKQADRALLPESLLSEKEARLLATQEKSELLKASQARLNSRDSSYQLAQKDAPDNLKIISYTVSLPKNSLQKRASRYVSFAEKESAIHQIPAPLIMAIMHSESAFNPNARSPVPAYGLMQIVPRTAGHDVNKLLRNIDKPMSADDLYIPQINVETGSAYLNILDKRYLKAIKNERSRLYCTIAAYNTGAGNVARVFNNGGSRNINKAAKIINQLSPDEVYQQLLAKLPYDETKHYLERVNSRIALYQTKL